MGFRIFLLFFLSVFNFSVFADGKDIFDRFCTACHSPAMAPMFNSPAAHDIKAWTERKNDALARAIEKNPAVRGAYGNDKEEYILEELILSAVTGTDKGMPPKGTCSDCTEEDIKSVIKFMSSKE